LDEVGRAEVDVYKVHNAEVRLEPIAEPEAAMDARCPVLIGVAVNAPFDRLLALLAQDQVDRPLARTDVAILVNGYIEEALVVIRLLKRQAEDGHGIPSSSFRSLRVGSGQSRSVLAQAGVFHQAPESGGYERHIPLLHHKFSVYNPLATDEERAYDVEEVDDDTGELVQLLPCQRRQVLVSHLVVAMGQFLVPQRLRRL